MKSMFGWVRDESGAVLSAEAALLGTVGVLGAVVGVNLFADSVNDEMRDVAYAIRSLDQSYSVSGHMSPTAWTAGSGYTQEPVEKSLARLREREEDLRERHGEREESDDRNQGKDRDGDRESERKEAAEKDRKADSKKERDRKAERDARMDREEDDRRDRRGDD